MTQRGQPIQVVHLRPVVAGFQRIQGAPLVPAHQVVRCFRQGGIGLRPKLVQGLADGLPFLVLQLDRFVTSTAFASTFPSWATDALAVPRAVRASPWVLLVGVLWIAAMRLTCRAISRAWSAAARA